MTYILSQRLSSNNITCTLFFDNNLKSKNFKITSHEKIKNIPKEFENIKNNSSIEPSKIAHCNICEFEKSCKRRLIEEDNLSLLGRISNKEILKHNAKGIFTINQLSYTFKPRRRKRTPRKVSRYLYELKALSLRENKTHVLNKRKLPNAENELFIDFEGNLNHSVYLIGIVLRKEKKITQHFFWSDDRNSKNIFFAFFEFISNLQGSYCLFHYGSYESKAIQKINKKFSLLKKEEIELLEKRMFNLLDCFYSDVFPPTYSNGLKEIANYLGFEWSRKKGNGIQVTYWRKNWILTGITHPENFEI